MPRRPMPLRTAALLVAVAALAWIGVGVGDHRSHWDASGIYLGGRAPLARTVAGGDLAPAATGDLPYLHRWLPNDVGETVWTDSVGSLDLSIEGNAGPAVGGGLELTGYVSADRATAPWSALEVGWSATPWTIGVRCDDSRTDGDAGRLLHMGDGTKRYEVISIGDDIHIAHVSSSSDLLVANVIPADWGAVISYDGAGQSTIFVVVDGSVAGSITTTPWELSQGAVVEFGGRGSNRSLGDGAVITGAAIVSGTVGPTGAVALYQALGR
jgi:hypothetical protein